MSPAARKTTTFRGIISLAAIMVTVVLYIYTRGTAQAETDTAQNVKIEQNTKDISEDRGNHREDMREIRDALNQILERLSKR